MKNSIYIFLILIAWILVSCVKFPDPRPGPIKPSDKITMGEAKVSDSFSWSTSNSVEVIITGLPTIVTVKSTLSISLQDGTRLYSLLHNMSQDLRLKIIVPSETTNLTLKYGSMEYNLKIIGNKAEFSFIPDIPEEIEVP
ncbi:MAG: hypothetical protein HGA83_02405 [Bacteroidales bacterium]|nr:hypothetical protein [Bacteroidales bacterium]